MSITSTEYSNFFYFAFHSCQYLIMMREIWLPFLYVFGLLSFTTAQPVSDDLPIVTNCIALVNAKLISAPGKTAQVSTIIIRDGLITHVGPNIKPPADAYRIASDSFYVYPAFIDAFFLPSVLRNRKLRHQEVRVGKVCVDKDLP